jgi:hypothetical protein
MASSRKPVDRPGEEAEAGRRPLLAGVEQHLQPEADPEERAVARDLEDDVAETRRVDRAHAVGHRRLAGQHDALGVAHLLRAAGDDDVDRRRDVAQRLRDRAKVAHAVVDDRDGAHQDLVRG